MTAAIDLLTTAAGGTPPTGFGRLWIDSANDHVMFTNAANVTLDLTAFGSKASGAEIDTGTDDVKFVTAKAIRDSGVLSGGVSGEIAGLAGKSVPVNADVVVIEDSAAANAKKSVTWANIKATLKTYFDTLYNLYVHPNHSGDVTSVADGATTIAASAVTLAKMANMATASLLGRNTAGSGAPEVLSASTVRSLLSLVIGTNVQAYDAVLTSWAGKAVPSGVPLGTTDTQTLTNKTLTRPVSTNPAETQQVLTDGATVNWNMDSGASARLTLGGNRTMAAPTNIRAGATYVMEVIQDATGTRLITWNAVFKWAGGTAPVLSTAANAKDLVSFYSPDGSVLWGNCVKGFA